MAIMLEKEYHQNSQQNHQNSQQNHRQNRAHNCDNPKEKEEIKTSIQAQKSMRDAERELSSL